MLLFFYQKESLICSFQNGIDLNSMFKYGSLLFNTKHSAFDGTALPNAVNMIDHYLIIQYQKLNAGQ